VSHGTDVAGYSRLMQDDEAATVKTLEAYKQVISHADRRMGWQNNTSTSALMN
jgi:hypothetical protein